MLTEDGKHLYVSYDEYHQLIEKLALKIHLSGWRFDTILCLARGGMRPGDILSRIFGVPLAIMSTSSYRAAAGKVQGHLDIAHYITTPQGQIAGRARASGRCGGATRPARRRREFFRRSARHAARSWRGCGGCRRCQCRCRRSW